MCKTIKQRVKFNAPPATVYDLLADSVKHSAVTGRKATISRKIGGTFSVSGNDVSGINVDLVPGRRIVQAWRHRRPPEGIFSMAAVTLTPTTNSTIYQVSRQAMNSNWRPMEGMAIGYSAKVATFACKCFFLTLPVNVVK